MGHVENAPWRERIYPSYFRTIVERDSLDKEKIYMEKKKNLLHSFSSCALELSV